MSLRVARDLFRSNTFGSVQPVLPTINPCSAKPATKQSPSLYTRYLLLISVCFGTRVLQLGRRPLSCPSTRPHVDCTLHAADLPQQRQQETRLAAPRWAVDANQLPRSDLHRDVTKGRTLELRGFRPVSTPARQQRCRNFFNLSFFLPFAVTAIFLLFLAILIERPNERGVKPPLRVTSQQRQPTDSHTRKHKQRFVGPDWPDQTRPKTLRRLCLFFVLLISTF